MFPVYSVDTGGRCRLRKSVAIPMLVSVNPHLVKRLALARVTCVQTRAARTLHIVGGVFSGNWVRKVSLYSRTRDAGMTKSLWVHFVSLGKV